MTTQKKEPPPVNVKTLGTVACGYVKLGCDPEFFFKVNKKVVGSERFIPPTGLGYYNNSGEPGFSRFIIDGVQAELNPAPYACRANLANEISIAFKKLKEKLDKTGEKVEVSFDQTVTITKPELLKLESKNQVFGCKPSFNIYDPEAHLSLARVDPFEYRKRSAGGHIHISKSSSNKNSLLHTPDKAIRILDIIVGNTCVLIDRDKGNKERRKLYGKAGEYRTPSHGLEYRVLSNFWLKAYPLMSLVFGLTRLSVEIMNDINREKYYKALTEAVSDEDVQKAINTNSYRQAFKNYKAIEPILMQSIHHNTEGSRPFGPNTLEAFNYFLETVKKEGLGYWFKEEPFQHWCTLPEAHNGGFYDFLLKRVAPELRAKTKV